MSQLSYDDEDYYFQISDELESDKEFVLIIYDIVDNRKRVKLAKPFVRLWKTCSEVSF